MINQEDLRALESYVKARDGTQFADLHEDTLILDITHSNLKQRHIEIRFDKHATISSVRDKVSFFQKFKMEKPSFGSSWCSLSTVCS